MQLKHTDVEFKANSKRQELIQFLIIVVSLYSMEPPGQSLQSLEPFQLLLNVDEVVVALSFKSGCQ